MKKLFYILSLAAVASLTVLSCQKEQEVNPRTPSPAEVAGCYGVYFPAQEASGDHVFNPTQDPEIEITVARTNDSGAITVPVKTTFSEDGIFVAQDIKFADGQKETSFKVTFENAKEGVNYKASFLIEDTQYASMYNSNPVGLDFSILRVEMLTLKNPVTKEDAKVTFTLGWWGLVVEAKVKYYEVDNVRTCETFDEVVILSNNEDAGDVGFWGGGADNHLHFTWFPKKLDGDNQMIDIPKQYLGFDYDDWLAKPIEQAGNPIFAYDWFHYLITDGGYAGGWPDWEGFLERNPGAYDRSYYDGNGGFYLNFRYYIPGLGGWTPSTFDTVGVVEGYTRVDYSLELETDYPSEGVTPIFVEAGVDVVGIKYAIYEGELTATQVGNKVTAITDGTDASVLFNEFELDEEEGVKFATLGVSPEATGVYTLVAVAIDKASKVQNSASIVFKHVAADDVEKYAVNIQVGAENVPARYTELDNISSMAFYVLGSDIVEAHLAVYPSATYDKNVAACNEAVKTTSKYALTEDQLAQVNAAGGFFDIISGLAPLTSYTVVVWATNGDLETIVTATHTTDGLPLEPVAVGSYTYKVAFPNWGTDTGVNLMYDPNYELYVIQSIFYYVDFYFDMDDKGIIHFEPQNTGATYQGTPIYVLETYDYYDDEYIASKPDLTAEQIADIKANSYYDSENDTYNFNMAFVVPNVGSFGHGWESFVADPAAPAVAPALFRSYTLPAVESIATKWIPAQKTTVYERDPQPVKASVKVDYTRKEKSADKKAFETEQPIMVR